MDSIFNDDKNGGKKKKKPGGMERFYEEVKDDGDEQKKSGEEAAGEQEDGVTVVPQNELKADLDEERKKRLAELMPDEVFKTPKTPGKRPACSNCLFMFSVGFLVVTLAAVLWGLQFFGKDLISSVPTTHETVKLTVAEKVDLEKKLEKYEEALEAAKRSKDTEPFGITLTGNQLNYLLEGFEKSIPGGRKIYLRAHPDGEQVKFAISFPFEKKGYMNVFLTGKPDIEAYQLKMDIFTIQIGSMKNASSMKKKVLDRINRELDQYPRNHGLPFRIYSMKVDTSVMHFTLVFKDKGNL